MDMSMKFLVKSPAEFSSRTKIYSQFESQPKSNEKKRSSQVFYAQQRTVLVTSFRWALSIIQTYLELLTTRKSSDKMRYFHTKTNRPTNIFILYSKKVEQKRHKIYFSKPFFKKVMPLANPKLNFCLFQSPHYKFSNTSKDLCVFKLIL